MAHYWLVSVAFALASCGTPKPQPQDPDDARSPAPANWKLPATGVLSLSELTNFAKQERDFVKADDFSKGFDDGVLKGRQFAVEVAAPNYGGSSTTMIHWVYDADKGELTINIDPSSTIQSQTQFGPKKRMSNAFGAEVEAESMETWQTSLAADYEQPLGVFPEIDSLYSFSGEKYGYLTHTMRLSPDQARQLTKNLRARLEGRS